ncbi:MAG: hypothetical protein K6T75_03660, partial [Acetobacteraceae bacterium]|nr:hypothetical protein [Acetobacteraceae bacterium]
LNRRLSGRSLGEIGPELVWELKHELAGYWSLVEETLESLRRSLEDWPETGGLVLDGAARMLGQPEFQDVQRARAVLGVLEQARLIRELLCRPLAEGEVAVGIGSELKVEEIRDCSLVVATFRLGSEALGRLGVLGPRRMEYGRVVALVAKVADGLSRSLAR